MGLYTYEPVDIWPEISKPRESDAATNRFNDLVHFAIAILQFTRAFRKWSPCLALQHVSYFTQFSASSQQLKIMVFDMDPFGTAVRVQCISIFLMQSNDIWSDSNKLAINQAPSDPFRPHY